MSLAPTISAPDLIDRCPALNEERRIAADSACSMPFPGQFATPTRDSLPRNVARLARLSLSTILRRLVRRTDSAPLATMATPCPPPTVRRKVFGDAQPNLLDDLTLFDELDPIPFVAHDDAARRDQPRSDHGGFCEESRDFPNFPSCIVAERREGRASPHWNFDCTGSNPIFECHLLDVTMSGIAIRTVRSFPRGSILDVRFNPTNSENVIETSGIVVRCEPSKAGGFQVVCRLEKFLRFAEIRDVGRDLFASAIV